MADEATTIWKFPLDLTDEQTVTGPLVSPMSVGLDPGGLLCLWACVYPAGGHRDTWTVRVVGTGNPLPEETGAFMGSVVDRQFVWHVFVDRFRPAVPEEEKP